MKLNLVPVKVPYDTHFKILFSPLFTGSRKNICILFYFAWIWKVTETRRPQGDLKGWTQRLAGGAANSLGKMSLSYHCFLWHHEGLICQSALQRASEFLQNVGYLQLQLMNPWMWNRATSSTSSGNQWRLIVTNWKSCEELQITPSETCSRCTGIRLKTDAG